VVRIPCRSLHTLVSRQCHISARRTSTCFWAQVCHHRLSYHRCLLGPQRRLRRRESRTITTMDSPTSCPTTSTTSSSVRPYRYVCIRNSVSQTHRLGWHTPWATRHVRRMPVHVSARALVREGCPHRLYREAKEYLEGDARWTISASVLPGTREHPCQGCSCRWLERSRRVDPRPVVGVATQTRLPRERRHDQHAKPQVPAYVSQEVQTRVG
jgi:hypothetical protein